MELRYVGDGDAREVVPQSHPPFTATRLDWVDVPREVAGKRPHGRPGNDSFDPGEGLLGQVAWRDDGTFEPLWETRAAKRAAKTKVANSTAAAAVEADVAPTTEDTPAPGEED